jgi:sugar lactone lactonase YvrE
MINGGGCSNGHPSDPEGLYRIHANGTAQPVADLGNFMRSNVDSKSPLDGDFEPDGTWFNLVRAFGAFYSTEPNHGLLVRIGDDGAISLVADLIAAIKAMDGDGDHTYSALTVHRGAFYVGTLGRIDAGFTASIYRVSRDGRQVTRVASGLHGVTGIAFDRAGRLYALETTAANVNPPLSDPTVGRLVRVEGNGSLTPLVTNLAFPTALLAGREGEFYISNCGYHCDDRSKLSLPSLQVGQVLRVTLPDAESDQDDARD